jgi:hypothetical protein
MLNRIICQNQQMPLTRALKEEVDPLFLQQAKDEAQGGFLILHTVLSTGSATAHAPDLKICEPRFVKELFHELDHRNILKYSTIFTQVQKFKAGYQTQPGLTVTIASQKPKLHTRHPSMKPAFPARGQLKTYTHWRKNQFFQGIFIEACGYFQGVFEELREALPALKGAEQNRSGCMDCVELKGALCIFPSHIRFLY